jgi:hypothetical protein
MCARQEFHRELLRERASEFRELNREARRNPEPYDLPARDHPSSEPWRPRS